MYDPSDPYNVDDARNLYLPDSGCSDFSVPELEQVDLSRPGFVLPDVERPDPALPDLLELDMPDNVYRPPVDRPDPELQGVTMPELPDLFARPSVDAHIMPQPGCEPEVVMQERPGELAAALPELLADDPDMRRLPPGIEYPELYTTQRDMTRRQRHLGMLELGLEKMEKDG